MDEELKKQSREELQKLPVEEQETLAVEYLKKTIGNMVSAGFTPHVVEEAAMEVIVDAWVESLKGVKPEYGPLPRLKA